MYTEFLKIENGANMANDFFKNSSNLSETCWSGFSEVAQNGGFNLVVKYLKNLDKLM